MIDGQLNYITTYLTTLFWFHRYVLVHHGFCRFYRISTLVWYNLTTTVLALLRFVVPHVVPRAQRDPMDISEFVFNQATTFNFGTFTGV